MPPQQYGQEMTITYKNNKTLLLENKMPLTCMVKEKATLPKITYPDIMEECDNVLYVEEEDKSTDRENKDAAHSNVNEYDT